MQLTAENQERLAVDDELGRTLLFPQIGRQLAVAVLRWFSDTPLGLKPSGFSFHRRR